MHKKTPITIQIFLHNSLRNVQQKDKNIIQHFLSQKIKKSQLYFFFLFSGGTKQTNKQLGTPRKKTELRDVNSKFQENRILRLKRNQNCKM